MTAFEGLRVTQPRGVASRWVRMIWQCSAYRSPGPAERILPHGAMELTWELERGHRFARGEHVDAITGPVLVGARAVPYWVETSRPQRLFGLVFAPGAAPDLLGVSAAELRHSFQSLASFPAARELEARLTEAGDWRARVRVVERAFQRPPRLGRSLRVLLSAWQQEPETSVRELCGRAGVSAPTFVKHVRHALGLRPAELRGIRRFRTALSLVAAGGASLGAIAQDAGYSDQAHMCRAFRAHAELPASRYRPIDPAHPYNISDGASVSFGSSA